MKNYLYFISTALNCLIVFCFLVTPLHAEQSIARPQSVALKNIDNNLMALLKRTKPVFYPECKPAPMRVGLEDYQDKRMALSGLEGVYLNIEGLLKSAGAKKVNMADQLKEQIIQRLAKGGLKLLTKEEMLITPGQPEISMFMTFPAHLTPVKQGAPPIAYRPDCCTMGIWTSFTQAGKILRDPDTSYKLSTWGEGHNTADCNNPGGWMSDVILKTVENFTNEKIKADKDYAALVKARQVKRPVAPPPTKLVKKAAPPTLPKKVSNPQAPVECNGAVRVFIDMFAANQTYLDKSQTYALQQLADAMIACPMYNYMIETHSDPRSSFAYNEKLSTLRAASIQGFLLGRGVSKRRFMMQSFGELSPITLGTTEQDYAANRRVVVRPYLAVQ